MKINTYTLWGFLYIRDSKLLRMNIAVLGIGMVGSAMARDLATQHTVTAIDISEKALRELQSLEPRITIRAADLMNLASYQDLLQFQDMVVLAVPGFMGFNSLRKVIDAGKNVVDISFFPEDSAELDAFAKAKGVTAVVDCGVAPGMGNILLGHHDARMEVNRFECLVGGLPVIRQYPFQYKAPFSPIDVIEEYTRPARLKEMGNVIVKPALTEREMIEFPGVGTLEAFNTDGLRSLLYTMEHIPDMKEKTLRYPGHVDLILALQQGGFFSELPVLINGQEVRPLDATAQVLFRQWKLQPEEEEFTLMRITVMGKRNNKYYNVEYTLLDRYDRKTHIHSMARTTGYTATGMLNYLLDGHFNRKGVFPPEIVGKEEGCLEYMLRYLRDREVVYHKKEWEA
jgi:lysine 6-dehydrogenase